MPVSLLETKQRKMGTDCGKRHLFVKRHHMFPEGKQRQSATSVDSHCAFAS